MLWFKSNKQSKAIQANLEQTVPKIVAQHQLKTDKVVAETTKVGDNLIGIIKENGFTLQIHAALGGKR